MTIVLSYISYIYLYNKWIILLFKLKGFFCTESLHLSFHQIFTEVENDSKDADGDDNFKDCDYDDGGVVGGGEGVLEASGASHDDIGNQEYEGLEHFDGDEDQRL